MPPKQRTKTSKTNITRPTPGGVKKRGESTAHKPRAKIPGPPQGWSRFVDVTDRNRQVRETVRSIKSLARRFKKLDDFLAVHIRYHTRNSRQTKRLILQRESKELKRLLDAVYFEIGMIDSQAIKPPILAFHTETRGKKAYAPLSVKEVKEYVNTLIDENRFSYEYDRNLKPGGANRSSQVKLGFEEFYVVPLYTFRELVNIGYPDTLTPLQRDLFMTYFKWVKTHTPPIIRKYMDGEPYNAANLAKIRGETYMPNFFSAAKPSSAKPGKRTR